MHMNELSDSSAARLLRVIKDPSPRVAAAARGGLFQLHTTSDDISPLVDEAIATLNPEVLETALIPSLTASSRRLAFFTLFSWRWYSFAMFAREALQKRMVKEGKSEGLVEVTKSLQRHTFAIFVVQNLMVVGLLILARMAWILFSSSTTPIITATEIMALQITILVLIGFLATAFSYKLVRLLSPIVRYRTLRPLPHLLSLLERGCGDDEVARDLAIACREDVRAQRQVVRMALDEAPGASKAFSISSNRVSSAQNYSRIKDGCAPIARKKRNASFHSWQRYALSLRDEFWPNTSSMARGVSFLIATTWMFCSTRMYHSYHLF